MARHIRTYKFSYRRQATRLCEIYRNANITVSVRSDSIAKAENEAWAALEVNRTLGGNDYKEDLTLVEIS